ncbi:uncharacterized protein [Euphorbia lathyris]|uniref:uncharacterized protein n=1 Tax=Euphorbia lathyris TaxID=212925 RepID=UPI0033138FBE
MYPIAWAVVEHETKHTWSWFLNLVRADLDMDEGAGHTVISDMLKGLIPAIKEIMTAAEHRECARHILANWAKKWRGVERRNVFWRVAKSTFEAEFKDWLEELSKLGENIVPQLLTYEKEKWCKVYFNTDTKCDSVDNNISKTFSGWILGPRYKTIIIMLEEIMIKVMEQISAMVAFSGKWSTDISLMSLSVLQANTNRSMQCNIIWNDDVGFEITEGNYRHVVDLKLLTCLCRAWALKGIPCQHAVAAMHKLKLDPTNYISHWYHNDTYIKAYSMFIQHVLNMKMWTASNHLPVDPPEIKTMRGRPKKNRRKSRDESKKFGKLSRKGAQMTCSYCKGPNHNKKGYPIRKNNIDQALDDANSPIDVIYQRKRKETGGETSSGHTNVTQGSNNQLVQAASSNKSAGREKIGTKKVRYGYGVFHSKKTDFAVQQCGRP